MVVAHPRIRGMSTRLLWLWLVVALAGVLGLAPAQAHDHTAHATASAHAGPVAAAAPHATHPLQATHAASAPHTASAALPHTCGDTRLGSGSQRPPHKPCTSAHGCCVGLTQASAVLALAEPAPDARHAGLRRLRLSRPLAAIFKPPPARA